MHEIYHRKFYVKGEASLNTILFKLLEMGLLTPNQKGKKKPGQLYEHETFSFKHLSRKVLCYLVRAVCPIAYPNASSTDGGEYFSAD